MKKVRFTEKQMVAILREADRSPVADVARKHKVSEQAVSARLRRITIPRAGERGSNGHHVDGRQFIALRTE